MNIVAAITGILAALWVFRKFECMLKTARVIGRLEMSTYFARRMYDGEEWLRVNASAEKDGVFNTSSKSYIAELPKPPEQHEPMPVAKVIHLHGRRMQ